MIHACKHYLSRIFWMSLLIVLIPSGAINAQDGGTPTEEPSPQGETVPDNVSVAVLFLVDVSGSMYGAPDATRLREQSPSSATDSGSVAFETTKFIVDFLGRLREQNASASPTEIAVSVVGFGTETRNLLDWTTVSTTTNTGNLRYPSDTTTPQHANFLGGVEEAIDQLSLFDTNVKKYVFVITDSRPCPSDRGLSNSSFYSDCETIGSKANYFNEVSQNLTRLSNTSQVHVFALDNPGLEWGTSYQTSSAAAYIYGEKWQESIPAESGSVNLLEDINQLGQKMMPVVLDIATSYPGVNWQGTEVPDGRINVDDFQQSLRVIIFSNGNPQILSPTGQNVTVSTQQNFGQTIQILTFDNPEGGEWQIEPDPNSLVYYEQMAAYPHVTFSTEGLQQYEPITARLQFFSQPNGAGNPLNLLVDVNDVEFDVNLAVQAPAGIVEANADREFNLTKDDFELVNNGYEVSFLPLSSGDYTLELTATNAGNTLITGQNESTVTVQPLTYACYVRILDAFNPDAPIDPNSDPLTVSGSERIPCGDVNTYEMNNVERLQIVLEATDRFPAILNAQGTILQTDDASRVISMFSLIPTNDRKQFYSNEVIESPGEYSFTVSLYADADTLQPVNVELTDFGFKVDDVENIQVKAQVKATATLDVIIVAPADGTEEKDREDGPLLSWPDIPMNIEVQTFKTSLKEQDDGSRAPVRELFPLRWDGFTEQPFKLSVVNKSSGENVAEDVQLVMGEDGVWRAELDALRQGEYDVVVELQFTNADISSEDIELSQSLRETPRVSSRIVRTRNNLILFQQIGMGGVVFVLVVVPSVLVYQRRRTQHTKLRGVLRVLKGSKNDYTTPLRPVGKPLRMDKIRAGLYELKPNERPPEPGFSALAVEYEASSRKLHITYEIKTGAQAAARSKVSLDMGGKPVPFYERPGEQGFNYFFHWADEKDKLNTTQ